MSAADPFDVLFAGLNKLGPGDNAHTRHVLRVLPQRSFNVIVDAGCGTGRQTLVLAAELNTLIHAVDSRASFLHELSHRARAAKLERQVQTHCMDMKTSRVSSTTSTCFGRKARRTASASATRSQRGLARSCREASQSRAS